IDTDRLTILDSFIEPLDALLEVDDLEEAQRSFDAITNDLIIVLQNHFNLSPRTNIKKSSSTSSNRNSSIDPLNAQLIQKQYRWNRRRCERNLTNPSSSTCQIKKEFITDHFSKTWASPESEYSFPAKSPPTLPPVIDLLSPEQIISCLQSCENSAPGPDRLSYQHWKTVDPRCFIISKVFNICLKLKNIPSAWKTSNCILIPKKGDLSLLENWRPISLSNSIYKCAMSGPQASRTGQLACTTSCPLAKGFSLWRSYQLAASSLGNISEPQGAFHQVLPCGWTYQYFESDTASVLCHGRVEVLGVLLGADGPRRRNGTLQGICAGYIWLPSVLMREVVSGNQTHPIMCGSSDIQYNISLEEQVWSCSGPDPRCLIQKEQAMEDWMGLEKPMGSSRVNLPSGR
ncbi:c2H2-type domain-containing protein, partial [Nephila pilipes]